MSERNDSNANYTRQMRLSGLSLLGGVPNFFALLFSALSTKAVLVYIDLLDTFTNVLRNALVVLISRKLRKDLRFRYNYGVGKIEALSSMMCDMVMLVSLSITMAFAVKDLITPRPLEGFMLFALAIKVLGVLGDIFVYWRQWRICRQSDSLIFRSAMGLAIKNLVLDVSALTALILMYVFGDNRLFWYLSPVVTLALGGYLLVTTGKQLRETIGIMLDRSADEDVQMAILKTLTALYAKYDAVGNVQSHVSGGVVTVDLELGFPPEMTYAEIKSIADEFCAALSESVPNCEVSLRIAGTKPVEPEMIRA